MEFPAPPCIPQTEAALEPLLEEVDTTVLPQLFQEAKSDSNPEFCIKLPLHVTVGGCTVVQFFKSK